MIMLKNKKVKRILFSIKLRCRKLFYKIRYNRSVIKFVKLCNKIPNLKYVLGAAGLVMAIGLVFIVTKSSSATPQTVTLNRDDYVSGVSKFGEIQLGLNGSSIQLQKGVAGQWTNTTNLQLMPSLGYGLTNLEYGPNDTLYSLTSFAGQCNYSRYDIERQTWSPLKTPPVACGSGTILVYDGVGSLYYAPGGPANSPSNRFFRYDIADDSWHNLENITTGLSDVSSGVFVTQGVNKYVYLFRGMGSSSFLRYNVSANSWQSMPSFPTTGSVGEGISMVWNGADMIYALANESGEYKKFNITTNTWSNLSTAPSSSCSRYSMKFVSGNVLAMRLNRCNERHSTLSYSTVTNTWSNLSITPSPANVRDWTPPLAYDGSKYAYTVLMTDTQIDMYRYNTIDKTWDDKSLLLPDQDNSMSHEKVIYDGGQSAYYFGGTWSGAVDRVYKYDTVTNQATRVGSQINTVSGFDGVYNGGSLYLLPMPNSAHTFQRYDTATNDMVELAELPYVVNAGADIIDGGDGYLYTIFGGGRTNFYRYNIATNVWSSLGSMPQPESSGGGLTRIDRSIFALNGASSGFMMKYNMDSTTWTTVAGMPSGDVDHGGFITSDGNRYLYICISGRFDATAKKVYRYDTNDATWQRIADLPASVKPYASAFYDTTKNKMYVSQGQWSSLLWTWSPAASNYVTSGTWYSKTYDLKQVESWTSLNATISGSGTTEIYSRSSANGNVWTDWVLVNNKNINSPVNRYLQLKVSLSGDGSATPIVSDINIQYDQESVAPTLPSQLTAYSKKDGVVLNSGQTYEHQHPYFNWSGAGDGVNGSGIAGYYVYFGIDSNADPVTDGNYQADSNYSVSTPMVAGDVNYLRIKTKDNLGNISEAATFFSYRYFYISPPGSFVKTSSNDFSEGLNSNVNINNGSMSLKGTEQGAWSTGGISMTPENVSGGTQKIVGDYLYIARGSGTTTFWRYNLISQTWSTMSAVPSAVNSGSTMAYDKNGNLFLITGNNTNNFYKYNIEKDSWTPVAASLPSNAQQGTEIIYIGNDKFVILFSAVREFYVFDASASQYSSLQPCPSAINYAGDGIWFDGNDTIYAYLGSAYWWSFSGSGRTNMAKYTISTDSWKALATSPVNATYTQNNLVSDGSGGLYVFSNNLVNNLSQRQMVTKYDITSDAWLEVPGFTDQVYNGTVTSDDKRYIYIIPNGSGVSSKRLIRYDTWNKQFTPTIAQIDSLDRIPYDSPTNAWQWVQGNSSTAVYDGSKYIYALAGSESWSSYSRFVKFDYKSGQTIYLPSPPTIGIGGSFGYVDSALYYMPAKNTREFYKFDEIASQWVRMNDIPVNAYRAGPSSLVTISGSLYISMGNGRNFYKYTPDTNGGVWLKLNDTPGTILNAAFTYSEPENAIYVLAGNGSKSFYRYDVSGNNWSTQTSVPIGISYGAAMTVNNGKIYAQIGNVTKNSYIYDIADKTWSEGASAPETFRYGSTILKIDSTTALALAGEGTPNIWQFVYPSVSESHEGLAVHISQPLVSAGIYDYAGITAKVNIPNNTSVEFWTRSSDDGNNWDDWSIANNIKRYQSSVSMNVTSKARNYTQVKAVLQSFDNIYTPAIDDYTLSYYYDIDPPSNPSVLTAYDDNEKQTKLINNTWYNNPKPLFDWPNPGEPGGATDGPLGSNIAGYWIYVGTDITASPRTSGVFVTDTEYQPTLSISGLYHVRIQAQDVTGNVDGNIYYPFVYKFDNTPPTNPALITVTPSGFTTKNNFTFEWLSSYDANSGVAGYCYHTGAISGPFADEVCQPGKKISDISAAYRPGTNVFYLRSYDIAGNYSPSYTTVSYYYATDPPGPVTNFRAVPPTSTQNLFSFAWDLPIQFSGDPDLLTYCYSINVLPSALNTTCTSDKYIAPFKAATQKGTNIIYMVAKDEADNANWNNFATANFIANTVSPGIPLNLAVNDTSDRVTNRWSLTSTWDKPTFVGNGIDNYIVERSEDGRVFTTIGKTSTLAFVDLNVIAGSTYYYRVRAADNVDNIGGASGIVSKSAQGNYALPPQIVVQPTITTGSDQAIVKWATSRDSTSFVYYGTNPGDLAQSKGSLELKTDHNLMISGLEPLTLYYFRVQSFDNDRSYKLNDAYSQIGTFRTTEAAKIYDVTTNNITSNSAIVSWRSTIPTQARLEYGTSLQYGFSLNDEATSYSSSHSMKITGLDSGVTYHFRVASKTEFGNNIRSDDYTFETIARPQVSNVRFQPLAEASSASVRVSWNTNVPTSSSVYYSALGTRLETTYSELTTAHEVVLKDLASNASYQITVAGRDQYGNLTTSQLQNWNSLLDTRPPVISNASYSVIMSSTAKGERAQLIASWKTDEPSTSQVAYDKLSSKTLSKKTPIDAEPTTSHVVIISDLNLADIYKVRISSRDLDGNTSYGSITTVVSPDKDTNALDNVLNLMVKLFTFGK